jgi:signal transduction histidine kinase
MRWFTLPFVVTALSYFILGLWVIARRKSKVHRLYGVFCLITALWQAIWILLFSPVPREAMDIALRCFYTGLVFIPAVFYHFIMEFSGQEPRRRWLYATYLICAILAVSTWIDGFFVRGITVYPWGLASRAGLLHPLFVLLVAAGILRSQVLLYRMRFDAAHSEIKKQQTKLVKLASLIYCGGAVDLVSHYGVSFFPLSFIFTGTAIVLFTYAMLRYEFLAMAVPPETEEELERREAATVEMRQLGMVAAFPLVSQGELLGYLLLGEKMSEESYSKEDLLLLRIVANQAALAYQRVRYLEMAVHGARTEMLGEIAGGFAHEIKTPLTNISLPAELSIMDLIDLEKGQKKLEDVLPELKNRMRDIMQQTMRASEKIEAIRQFSKPGQIQLEAVDLSSVLRGSLELLDHLLRKTNTRVRSEFPAIMSPIQGDAKQLEIVFVNLIKNAAEAMTLHPSAGLARDLWLKGHEDANWVITSIKDSGPGIRRTDIGHIFDAYFTTKGSDGTGMGLFLSRQVIKAHGGSIDVKSEEGKGTEFIIRLPKYLGQEHARVHHEAA